MSRKTLQDLLSLVEQPSRYLGSEQNRIIKNPRKVKMRIALAFPELYEIGTSHFGIQILYHIINQHEDFFAERVFCPANDMKAHLKARNLPLMSLETQTPMSEFDLIGFSLLYELNYTNILSMLDLGNIPIMSTERDHTFPIVIAGGPCTCNPEPVTDIFDAVVVGDGETAILELLQHWIEWKAHVFKDKEALLRAWSRIEGIYVPRFYKAAFDEEGLQTLLPFENGKKSIKRATVADLNTAPFPDRPIVPYGRPVHDRLRLEISRGCTRGCRFCQAGMIYRPVRERSPQTLLTLSHTALSATGYQDISLLSLSTGDYKSIDSLIRRLMETCEVNHTAISLPSLRAGTLTPELIELIKKVRKTGFTIAPEAGSQRLRDMINKGISEQDILNTVRNALLMGWQLIKLYFMVGFPGETENDLAAIVELVKELRKLKDSSGRKVNINVSVATFIPKPHTPFQWASQISLEESKAKIRWLQEHLRFPGIRVKWQQPQVSIIEGLWARGDRKLNTLLAKAYENGCGFDGWSDSFRYASWRDAISQSGIDLDFYTTRKRELSEPLPWDHIDFGVSKAFLQKEWEKALLGEFTPDCREGCCQDCGVCNFKNIAPIVYTPDKEKARSSPIQQQPGALIYRKAKVSYRKIDQAKYFGHIEMVNLISRALRRAELPVKFTEGFHPKPKMSFEDPLPIGVESRCEAFYIQVPDHIQLKPFFNAINTYLPSGLSITDYEWISPSKRQKAPQAVEYFIEIYDGEFNKTNRDQFMKKAVFPIAQKNRKGRINTLDLKKMVADMKLPSRQRLFMTLVCAQGKILRPFDVIEPVFRVSREAIRTAKIIKIGKKYE